MSEVAEPIAMLLWCPECGARHVDTGLFATKPHHTHACQSCGNVWRPAIENTLGVQFLPGFKSDGSSELGAEGAKSGNRLNRTIANLERVSLGEAFCFSLVVVTAGFLEKSGSSVDLIWLGLAFWVVMICSRTPRN